MKLLRANGLGISFRAFSTKGLEEEECTKTAHGNNEGDSDHDRHCTWANRDGGTMGVGNWRVAFDERKRLYYFYEPNEKKSRWGLPLREVLKNLQIEGPPGDDDWVCNIDKNGRKFYTSKRWNKTQWKVPLVYRDTIGKLEFFQQPRSRRGCAEAEPEPGLVFDSGSSSERGEEEKTELDLDSVLADTKLCAEFHRFLVKIHAEESLLFYAAAQVFENGGWKGMQVLGYENDTNEPRPESELQLEQQLIKSRVSLRIGEPISGTDLVKEARTIYEKFVKPESELWICTSSQTVERIRKAVESEEVGRDLFREAKEQVLDTMKTDCLPRFVNEIIGSSFI